VHDRFGTRRVERAFERRRVLEVEAHARERGRRRRVAGAGRDLVRGGEPLREPPADQPAGAGDEDPQPAITAPPLTARTVPQT
jgi:hypothetical protein